MDSPLIVFTAQSPIQELPKEELPEPVSPGGSLSIEVTGTKTDGKKVRAAENQKKTTTKT